MIFFNNVGYLGMCGHGTIGVAVALAHLGRIGTGAHRIETPVGRVTVSLEGPKYRHDRQCGKLSTDRGASVDVPELGTYTGDVAWGGNWFFLVHEHGEELTVANVDRLADVTWRIRQALVANGITGAEGAEIDHIELYGPPTMLGADSKCFVLCPGRAYDRSPCGTGTSAKIACLFADGKLAAGRGLAAGVDHRSVFEAWARNSERGVRPQIRGTAYVNAESTLDH